MIPTEEAVAAMAAVVCEPEDGGHPFAWSEPHTPAVAPQAAPDATPGPKTAPRAAHGRAARFLTLRRTK